ncbi:MAG TPA: hypothetical protein VF215_05695, partial [Thermoanaerobaculia bacterium]
MGIIAFSLLAPHASAADLYVRVYLEGCSYVYPPCGETTTWTSYAVVESRLYGYPFVVDMRNSHTVSENNHLVESSAGGDGYWSDWDSHLQGFATVPDCYRAQAHSFAGSMSQGSGTAQVCWEGPVTCPAGQSSCDPSPITINLAAGPYRLTSASEGVFFDIDADGLAERIAWTDGNTNLAFLARDRNHNGRIDDGSELFGNYTKLRNGVTAANGFEALAELDTNGDSVVNSADSSWQDLLLWVDHDHDGRSSAEELIGI